MRTAEAPRAALASAFAAYLAFIAYQSLAGAARGARVVPLVQQGSHLSRSDGLANLVAYVPQAEQVTERVYVDQQLYQQQYDHYRSSFPWHTAVGAGIGAIIGNQSDHLEEGAWIGAGVGFLMDAFRLH